MKNLLKKISLAIVVIMFSSCSVEDIARLDTEATVTSNMTCNNATPEARFVNNGTVAFNFKIYDSNMSLLAHFQDVAPGTTTDWTSFTEGELLFTIEETTASGISDQKMETLINNCSTFDVTISSNNQLLNNSPIQN
jgi:hypothetical protein